MQVCRFAAVAMAVNVFFAAGLVFDVDIHFLSSN
jgi:hypothetical protein